jgi:hypothetical protein
VGGGCTVCDEEADEVGEVGGCLEGGERGGLTEGRLIKKSGNTYHELMGYDANVMETGWVCNPEEFTGMSDTIRIRHLGLRIATRYFVGQRYLLHVKEYKESQK